MNSDTVTRSVSTGGDQSTGVAIKVTGWLTTKRLRAHGVVVGICLWSVFVWTLAIPGLRDRNGNLKGTDFLHLYTLGSLAAAHRGADLYDINAQAALAAQRVPAAAGIRYLPLYPPQVSMFFAPLAHFSYGWALAFWWLFSTFLYGSCCYAVWRVSPGIQKHGLTVLVLAAAFPAFFHLIAWGQTSALALACFTLMFFLLRGNLQFAAGLVLGCLIFKPQLALAAAIVFIAAASWKIAAGAILSAALQLSAGVLYYGIDPCLRWIERLRGVRSAIALLEPRPYQTYCLRTFWSMLLPWSAVSFGLYLLSAVAVLGITIAIWRRDTTLPLATRYSALLVATVLVSPHLTVYDLVILAPAFLLMAEWMVEEPYAASGGWLGPFLYSAYMLPLVGILTRWTHVQILVIVLTTILFVIWREGSKHRAVEIR